MNQPCLSLVWSNFSESHSRAEPSSKYTTPQYRDREYKKYLHGTFNNVVSQGLAASVRHCTDKLSINTTTQTVITVYSMASQTLWLILERCLHMRTSFIFGAEEGIVES